VLIPTPAGIEIPLGQFASIEVRQGPMTVKTEGAFPVSTVFVDIETSDLGGYVERARETVSQRLELPPGYSLMWSGQYEFMQRVTQKMKVLVPVTIGIIFLLLFLNFGSLAESLIVMLSLPFALVGGIWFLWLLGYNTSVAVWVGFIALAGVAAEIGVVMMIYLDDSHATREREGRLTDRESLREAVREGALERLRPVAMTVTAITFGLMPILWGAGAGADTMKRIAAPMVGGMVSATALTLLVIPAIYVIWKGRALIGSSE
jgi:Cu(I)/Ag(I) efflux system membrane protein CusA/SilA